MGRKNQNFRKFLLIFIFLLLLPVSLTYMVVCQILNDLEAYNHIKVREQLSAITDQVSSSAHVDVYFKAMFDEFSSLVLALEDTDMQQRLSLHAQIEEKAGTEIYCVFFDKTGTIIETDLYEKDIELLLQYLWHYIIDFKNSYDYQELKPQMQKNFGRNFHPRQLRGGNSKSIMFKSGSEPGLMYFSRGIKEGQPDRRGVLLYIRRLPSQKHILQETIEKISQKDVVLAIQTEDKSEILLADPTQKDLIDSASKIFSTGKKDFFVSSKRAWHRKNIADFSVIVGTSIKEGFHQQLKILAFIIAFALLLSGLLLCRKFMLAGQTVWVSIRFKLVVLFVFSVYLPLLGLFFLSFRGLHDRRIVLENNVKKAMLDVLYKLDSDFSQKEEEILATFNRLYNDRSWQKSLGADPREDNKLIKRRARVQLTGENFFNWLEVRNSKLEQLFCTIHGVANDRIKDFNRIMALISLEKFAPQVLAPEARRVRQSDFLVRNVIENPVIGFSHYFEVPGQLVPMEFEGAFLYWYWNYYEEPIGDVVFFSGNTKIQFNILKYLEKALQKRYALDNVLLKVAAFSPAEQKWMPDKYYDKPELAGLTRICALNSRVTTNKIELDDQLYLATCFPGIKMREIFLACMYPLSEIDRKIEILRRNIYYGMLLILIVAVLTGLLLTSAFLKPVGELNRGLTALRSRDTDFRVEIENRDEFGDLGATFNQMMVEVKEMLLANAVQQCLIPTEPPEIEGYELVVFNKMVADVGGDYADAFILPEDKFLLVLGDVTGHGISSSILTAMVKALVFRYSKNPGSLSELLRQLSEMIFDLLKHRKLMTFCALLVDKKTGAFDLANAGHPFPLLVDKNGKVKAIEHTSLPLGVSKKRSRYKEEHGVIKPQEICVMYTDGIAEATNKAGKMFGFDRVAKIISENSKNSAEKIKDSLLEEFFSYYDQPDLDDDLTFVILKRKSLGNS